MCDGAGLVPTDDDPRRFYQCPECQRRRRDETWSKVCPRRFWDADIASITQPEAAVDAALRWLSDECLRLQPPALLLFGPVGAGKTFLAYAVLRELHRAGWPVAGTSAVMLFESLRPDRGGSLADYIQPAALLIDDLGTEKDSAATDQALFAIVDQRWRDGNPTIVTTNLTPKQLEEAVGRRVYDRLADDALALTLNRRSQRARRSA